MIYYAAQMKMIAYICTFKTQIFEHKLNTHNEKKYMLFEKKNKPLLIIQLVKSNFFNAAFYTSHYSA